MTPAILGTKIGMTRVYDADGRQVPVTVIQAGPCTVTQVKSADGPDGYFAVQLGYADAKPKHSTMPLIGHAAKAGSGPKRHFKEIRLADAADKALGETVDVGIFDGIAYVDVTGTSKGKGFAGAMKRHGFGGLPSSHGTERKHRSRGSIGAVSTNRGFSGRPKKGIKMAGRMGNETVTTRNHSIVRIDRENNLILIKGCLPGPNGNVLFIKKAITAKAPAA